MLFKKISKKQAELYAACAGAVHDVISSDGSIRVGKTMLGMYGWLEYIINGPKNTDYGILGHSVSTVEANVEKYLIDYLQMRGIPYISTKYKITIQGNIVIRYYGASNKISFRKFQGATLRGVFIDEAPLLDPKAIKIAFDRTKTFKKDRKIILTSNPEGSTSHWYYRDYIANNRYKTFQFRLDDNPLFTEEDVQQAKEEMVEVDFQRKILGKWVISSGACYPVQPLTFKEEEVKEIEFEFSNIGVDEGRVDTTAGYLVSYVDGHFYVMRKFRNDKPNYSIINIAEDLRVKLNEWANEFDNMEVFFETNPGTLYNMFSNDLTTDERVDIRKVNKTKENYKASSAIQERIDITNMLIAMGKLHVHEDCTELLESFNNAVYDDKGVRLDDHTFSVDDLDAFEYAIKSEIADIYDDYYEFLERGDNERVN